MITLTKEQLSEVMCKHAEKENGVNDLLEIMLESLMVAERGEFLQEQADRNKGNGYRLGHTYGHGRKLEFRIPRDRFGNFHPKILAILKDQEEECERLSGSLYTKGLTQSQVGQVFDEIYGEHYSKASISRMIEYVRRDVAEWLERGLDEYYPIVFVDCVHIKVFRAGDKNYTVEQGVAAWKEMCLKWGKDYRSIRNLAEDEDIGFYFTYLNYAPHIQAMIYTTNWIERLQKDFRRVTRMRGAMPDELSVIVLMGKTAMDKESYRRVIPRMREERVLFPNG